MATWRQRVRPAWRECPRVVPPRPDAFYNTCRNHGARRRTTTGPAPGRAFAGARQGNRKGV